MKTFLILVLVLVGVLAGGCSLFFSPFVFGMGGDLGLFLIWFSGIALAGLSFWGARRVSRGSEGPRDPGK